MSFKWTEDKYKKICIDCDLLLLSSSAKYITVANPWLHVIRAHPIFLGPYEIIFKKKIRSYINGWLRISFCIFRLLRAVFNKNTYWAGKIPKYSDVLIISHTINLKDAGKEDDFYYGNLAQQLEKYKIPVTVALINHTKDSSELIAEKYKDIGISHVVLKKIIGFKVELKLFLDSQIEAFRLKSNLKKELGTNLNREVIRQAAILTRQGYSIGPLRIAEQIRILVKKLQPKVIIVTYEGHSWERLAFSVSRSVLPSITCIGYQHTTIFYLQHALQRLLGGHYDPDVILTSGDISKQRLKLNPNLANIKIKTLGTYKSYQLQTNYVNIKKITCLVVPEGLDSECFLLFNYSIKCAILMPNIEFIWRIHPIMDFKSLKNKFPLLKMIPKNITISNQSIISDLKNVNFALYRGSSSIIQAVTFGVRPVYLKIQDEITIDPLYEVEELRESVINPDDFKLVTGRENKNLHRLKSYCEKLYMPLDVTELIPLINSKKY